MISCSHLVSPTGSRRIPLRLDVHGPDHVVPGRIAEIVARQIVAAERAVVAVAERDRRLVAEPRQVVALEVPEMLMGVDDRQLGHGAAVQGSPAMVIAATRPIRSSALGRGHQIFAALLSCPRSSRTRACNAQGSRRPRSHSNIALKSIVPSPGRRCSSLSPRLSARRTSPQRARSKARVKPAIPRQHVRMVHRIGPTQVRRIDAVEIVAAFADVVAQVADLGVVRLAVHVLEQEPHTRLPGVIRRPPQAIEGGRLRDS